jgi:transketolase
MFEITPKMIKTWSTVGQRATIGLVLLELAKCCKDLFVITADVSSSAGLDRFSRTFPDQFLDVGIAEQNMIGVAAGIADNGFKVVTTTFAPFQSLRCCEQIKVDLAYTNTNVSMIGLASGLINGPLGNTHCCVEDLGSLRSIPNLRLVSPADGLGVARTLINCIEQPSPTYIRLTGGTGNPIVYQEDCDLVPNKSLQLRSGQDLTIFASGSMVFQSLIVADLLSNHGLSAAVWDMHTIKPIDESAVKKAASQTPLIVGVEEHNIIGGLSSAIAECLCTYKNDTKFLPIGVRDVFLKPGNYEYMLKQSGLDPESISSKILGALDIG